MSDEDALLNAIAAHPDEDTPRLAYADWLDENDRPIRAEFIRVQCALKRPESLSTDEVRTLLNRQQFLIENHRRDIVGPLGADLIVYDVLFDRGFVAELRVTALLFVMRAEAFGELRPVPRVRVGNLNRLTFDRFIRRPELTCVVAFSVGDPAPPTAVAGCPYLTALEELEWPPYTAIGDTGLEALAFSDNLPALIDLNVGGNEISDAGVERLVASPLWRRVKRLNLSHNQLTPTSAEHLANAPDNRIEYLGLHSVHVGSSGRRRLVQKYGERVSFS